MDNNPRRVAHAVKVLTADVRRANVVRATPADACAASHDRRIGRLSLSSPAPDTRSARKSNSERRSPRYARRVWSERPRSQREILVELLENRLHSPTVADSRGRTRQVSACVAASLTWTTLQVLAVAIMQLSDGVWPDRLPAVEVRIARPTDKLAEVLDFYCGHLGLPELIEARHGYQVVMVGLPGDKYHLEFTSHDDGSPGRAPSDENLLVFYFAPRTRCSTSSPTRRIRT